MNVRTLLSEKNRTIWSIRPEKSVYEALEIMRRNEVGALIVMREDLVVGIISERDYARKVILEGKSSRETQVSEVMSRKVVYVEPGTSVDDCMALMTYKRHRHLPVIDNTKLIGVVSMGDIVKSIITEKENEIEHLVSYISGTY